jgi:uncharacterized protein
MPRTPTPPSERFLALDVLRGFALSGVFFINFAYGDTKIVQPSEITHGWNAVASWILVTVFEDRFWPLFSLSFGVGFSLLLLRSERRGEPFLGPYLRRLAALFVFGWLCDVVLQGIPILNRYAIGGLALLPFVRASNQTVLCWSVGLLLLSVVDAPVVSRYQHGQLAQHRLELEQRSGRSAVEQEERQAAEAEQAEDQFFNTARYIPLIRHDTAVLARWVLSFSFYVSREVQIVGVFLLGLCVGRAGILTEPERHRRLLRTVAITGVVVGLISWSVYQLITGWSRGSSLWIELLQRFDYTAFYLSSALCYGATVVLLVLRPGIRRLLMPLAHTGRLALTNFLMQFVLGFIVFSRFGLGWGDRLGTGGRFALVLVVFAVQVWFSGWWLRRFRFGPAEWLWRLATYGSVGSRGAAQFQVASI